jgi:Methylamine utilisation protein MauE
MPPATLPPETLGAIQQVQIPVLAALLLVGCGAKAHRALRTGSVASALGPTAIFPLSLRRPIAMLMCASELGLGIGLVVTAGRAGAGAPAITVRAATALLFLTALGALHELRERRPGAGCGCFGDLSTTPVGIRSIARSGLLLGAAVASVRAPAMTFRTDSGGAQLRLALLAAELVLIAALSPELGEILVRLGYAEPCELRRLPVERTIAALHRSSAWRRHADLISAPAPSDVWREGCWRYILYPGMSGGRRIDIIFAVYLQSRRPAIRAAALDARTDEVLTRPPVPGYADPATPATPVRAIS